MILRSLRSRLIVLLLLVFVPAAAMMVLTHVQQRRFLATDLEQRAGRLVRLAIGKEEAIVDSARALLIALANADYIARGDTAACRRHVATIVRAQRTFLNLGYVDAGGSLVCSALAAPGALDFSDRNWFQDARESGGFTGGEYLVSRVTGERVIVYGYPIIARGGEFRGVAYAMSGLSWLEDMVSVAALPAGSVAMVVDAAGTVLARHPGDTGPGAAEVPAQVREAIARRPAARIVTSLAADGEERAYGIAPLRVGQRDVYVLIGLPSSAVLAVVEDALRANLALLTLLALLAFGGAWFGAESLIMRRVRGLVEVADRVAGGELPALGREHPGIREFDQIGAALDRMLEALQRQQKAREDALHELRDSESRYRDLVELSPEPIFILVAGRVRYANRAAVDLVKAESLSQLIGTDVTTLVDPDCLPAVEARLAQVMRGQRVPRMEQRYRCFDGSVVDVEVSSASYLYRGERAIQVFARDVTERRRIEQELRRSEASLTNAQRIARLGNWDLDIASGRLDWSAQIFEIFGLQRSDFGASYEAFLERVHPEDRARLQEAQRAALAGEARLDVEHRIVRPDGSVRTVHEIGDLTRDGEGRPAKLVGTVLDVTERRRFIDELERANARLRILSQRILEVQEAEQRAIARELHDEIGQALSAIKINIQSLQRMELPARCAKRLDEMLAVAQGAINQVRGMALDLRPGVLDDLGLEAALRWNANRLVATAEFAVHFNLGLGDRRLDSAIETACYRVCQEALTNVVRHANARNVYMSCGIANGELVVEVRDDGIGFDATERRRRAHRSGGFGLLGMEERVSLCGGRIDIVSCPGRGTTVRAALPIAPSTAELTA